MIEAEWWDYETSEDLAEAVVGDVHFIINQAMETRGQALIALPGGSTPLPIYEKLADAAIKWKYVTIIPGDDRLVAVDNPLSNAAMLARIFIPKGARVLPIASTNADYKAAGAAADARLQDIAWPPDLVWLGVGGDGHTASIFPGPDLETALEAPKSQRAVGVLPHPLPPEAPIARVTLTRRAILAAHTLMVVITGEEKKHILEQAIADGTKSPFVVGRVLAHAEQPIDIHWCK